MPVNYSFVSHSINTNLSQCVEIKNTKMSAEKIPVKHLCRSLFFNKVADLACNFIKKEILAHVFLIFENALSSHQSYSIKKTVLKNLAIFTGKRLCWSIFVFVGILLEFLKNLQAFRPRTLLKRDFNKGVFQGILRNVNDTHREKLEGQFNIQELKMK